MKVISVDPIDSTSVYTLPEGTVGTPTLMVTGSSDVSVSVGASIDAIDTFDTYDTSAVAGGQFITFLPAIEADGFFTVLGGVGVDTVIQYYTISTSGVITKSTSSDRLNSSNCASLGTIDTVCRGILGVSPSSYNDITPVHVTHTHRVIKISSVPYTHTGGRGFFPLLSLPVAEFGSTTAASDHTGLNTPTGVTVTDTHVYIADRLNHRIVVLDGSHLTYVTAWGHTTTDTPPVCVSTSASSGLHYPHDTSIIYAYDTEILLLVADTYNHRVVQFSIFMPHVATDGITGSQSGGWSATLGSCSGVSAYSTHPYETVDGCKWRCATDTRCDGISIKWETPPYPRIQGVCSLFDIAIRVMTCVPSTSVEVYRLTRVGSLIYSTIIGTGVASSSSDGFTYPSSITSTGGIAVVADTSTRVVILDCTTATGPPLNNPCTYFSHIVLATSSSSRLQAQVYNHGRYMLVAYVDGLAGRYNIATLRLNTTTNTTTLSFEVGGAVSTGSKACVSLNVGGTTTGTISVYDTEGLTVHMPSTLSSRGWSVRGSLSLCGRLDYVNRSLSRVQLTHTHGPHITLYATVSVIHGIINDVNTHKINIFIAPTEGKSIRCPIVVSDVCANRGYCVPNTSVCVCSYPYFGQDCTSIHCLKKCLNGGVCDTSTGVCVCVNGYSGDECEHPTCPQYDGYDCGNRGYCTYDTNVCVCQSQYYGISCEYTLCHVGSLGDYCSGKGNCNYDTGVCVCDDGYFGSACQNRHCGGYIEIEYNKEIGYTVQGGDINIQRCGNRKYSYCDTNTGGCSCNDIRPYTNNINNYKYYGSEDCESYQCSADKDLTDGVVDVTTCGWGADIGSVGGSYCDGSMSRGVCVCDGGASGWDCSTNSYPDWGTGSENADSWIDPL
eukprot:GHVR01001077.1.p1 GENE.GHVR01001077.1~~GHVR01001077.1.p1  ORF type:complete len:891 (-),score=247.37 GHVR01001077.1:155-2827(-)